MKSTKKNNAYQSFDCMRAFRDSIDLETMHPDDYSAHRAWVAAKRSHEWSVGKVS